MAIPEKTVITVMANIKAPVQKVWNLWTDPAHIIKWNNASPDWHTPSAENDLRVGGKFLSRMEARDGSMGFDFSGIYEKVDLFKNITYVLGDGRKVEVIFAENEGFTAVTETFEAEEMNSIELQKEGWQSILDNFRKYAAGNSEVLSQVTLLSGIKERELYRAIQFYDKYPDLDFLPDGKNISWHKIVNNLLPDSPEEKPEPETCPTCGQAIRNRK